MKSIIFNTEMVKAILDSRKTQFRFPIKKEKICEDWIMERQAFKDAVSKYKVDDILYVKETFGETLCGRIRFKADGGGVEDEKAGHWKPSIHLKQKDARIFLKVTNVRAERLQDITLTDMICEGINHLKEYSTGKVVKTSTQIKREFINLWNSTAKDGYKYEDNPCVFVDEFERIDLNEAR
jgi:hypothetical protein